MKFQYLGTGAAEGWPGVFCDCEYCREAARRGGRNIRTRAQALINDDLLLDLPPDTYMHKLRFGLDLSAVRYLFVTHCHMDHFFPQELSIRGSVFSPVMKSPELHIFCAAETKAHFDRCAGWETSRESAEAMHWHILKAFEPVQAGPYTVTPLPARHMGEGNEPFLYHIKDAEGVSVFYLHDSGWYAPEVWDYFARAGAADLVSLDTTNGELSGGRTGGHMGVPDVLEAAARMREIGLIDSRTQVVMNHFSHNGHLLYEELSALGAREGLVSSYDGMLLSLPPR